MEDLAKRLEDIRTQQQAEKKREEDHTEQIRIQQEQIANKEREAIQAKEKAEREQALNSYQLGMSAAAREAEYWSFLA